jgi:nitrate/nitrite transporter NarK
MFSLVFAGEAVFCLPFHISRYFRPTFVEVFDITQTQLGVLGSLYGAIAMGAYLLGGGLADRFSVRKLLAFALLATGLSGFYLVRIPSYPEMCVLFMFWGVSTILPFWSALIKATRQWGGHDEQGEAFGILDGGRGLLAAALATTAVFLFSLSFPEVAESATLQQKTEALRNTIVMYTVACLLAAVCTWFFVPESSGNEEVRGMAGASKGHLFEVLRLPVVWLQAVIILAAYCTYKGIDYYSQYAKDVWDWSDVRAASLSAYSSWLRPVAAIGAGLLADRIKSSRTVILCFALTGLSYMSFVLIEPQDTLIWLLWSTVIVSCLGIFALRGVYFALLEESGVPENMTGTAVGVISFIGYTPEIFMPLFGGWLIDRWSGEAPGYHVVFGFLGTISAVGVWATISLRRRSRLTTRSDASCSNRDPQPGIS